MNYAREYWFLLPSFFKIEHTFLYWFLLFLLEDFTFYIERRVDHYCRIFWAVHVTHHSSEQ
jgi:sterol desaturase/sphingolipid hydroxylase (fatty acid hydroxylase superfamily)